MSRVMFALLQLCRVASGTKQELICCKRTGRCQRQCISREKKYSQVAIVECFCCVASSSMHVDNGLAPMHAVVDIKNK